MTEKQVDEILREIYSFLLSEGIISEADWQKAIEPRIKAAAERIAGLN